ncbi:ankyrin repeat and BTB/POZ domain-containing protein 1 [Eurytemora carolleeae]|uniref:ankyrin repeat and BTB/POZ domain-containing protein 1 n=1 Tax=Eurytemora carolleeae TaxID=1294199 RepID=UPI000C7679FA|nr:ankyrin repeat and BTB/POZ domain-containing protein 1 [Eurytemora carolleeae]|eukprot:XP_023345511.1 ankyrin repeat and BTB/POZ domain-containing protein 1-like [Eurytemora affinis]
MDIQEFFHSCKKGDITRVKYLCEEKDIDVNLRDKWDSTPLYYACLCGHHHIVEYLLHRGAMCDANTFDGERCVYGALTNQIRKLLLEHRMLTSSTMRREPYTEFLRRLFEDETYNDITFSIHGVKISAHRCILSTRSHFFTQQLETRWKTKKNVILNKKEISPLAFRYILEWMYTGQVKSGINMFPCTLYCQLIYLSQCTRLLKT